MSAIELKNVETIKAAGHRVIVKPDAIEEVSEGGIIMPTNNKERKEDAQAFGVIIDVGPNAWKGFDDGEPWAKVGDRVLFAKYGGYAVKIKDEMLRVMNDEDITAIIGEA